MRYNLSKGQDGTWIAVNPRNQKSYRLIKSMQTEIEEPGIYEGHLECVFPKNGSTPFYVFRPRDTRPCPETEI